MYRIASIVLCMHFCAYPHDGYEDVAQAYYQGDYQHVITVLEEYDNKNSTAWYILADSYFHEQHYPQALAAIRFARFALPFKNINAIFTLTKNSKQQLAQPFSAIKEWVTLIVFALPERVLKIVFMLCWWLFFISFPFVSFGNYYRLFRMLILTLLLVIGSVLCIVKIVTNKAVGVVIEQTPLYILPEEKSPQRAVIAPGNELPLKEHSHHHWFKTQQNGINGWIPAQSIVRIEKDLSLSKVHM